jgi:glycosyltransferase involved in cell wall biosynthesis
MPVPLVSVVMPIYNAARYLDAAIHSIRAQTLTDLELILVDDGSTDDCDHIICQHASVDERIVVLRLPRAGISTALNHGIVAARAALIARMDADDEAMPERLDRQVAAMRARPLVAALGTGLEVIDADGHVVSTATPFCDPEEIRELLLQANCLAHPAVMMRRDVVLAAGGYRPAFTACEDYDLWLRLSEHHELSNLQEPLLRYRSHEDQSSVQKRPVRLLQALAAQHAARVRRAGLPDPLRMFGRIDTATLRAIGVPRGAILAALDGEDVPAPALPAYLSDRRRAIPTAGDTT